MLKNSLDSDYVIYVGGIPKAVNSHDIESYFSQYGQIKEIMLQVRKNGNNVGFCHISLVNRTSYESIMSTRHFYEGKSLKVERHLTRDALRDKHHDINLRRVIVYKLKRGEWSHDNFKELTLHYGEVEQVFLNLPPIDEYIDTTQLVSGIVVYKNFESVTAILTCPYLVSMGIEAKIVLQKTSIHRPPFEPIVTKKNYIFQNTHIQKRILIENYIPEKLASLSNLTTPQRTKYSQNIRRILKYTSMLNSNHTSKNLSYNHSFEYY